MHLLRIENKDELSSQLLYVCDPVSLNCAFVSSGYPKCQMTLSPTELWLFDQIS